MKKIVFFVESGYVGGDRKETFEFEDNVTDEQIRKEFEEWLYGNEYAGWYEKE